MRNFLYYLCAKRPANTPPRKPKKTQHNTEVKQQQLQQEVLCVVVCLDATAFLGNVVVVVEWMLWEVGISCLVTLSLLFPLCKLADADLVCGKFGWKSSSSTLL